MYTEDAAAAWQAARAFLLGDPVRNNLILTLLSARLAAPEPGRYWVLPAGVVFLSPLGLPALLSPMPEHVVEAAVDEVAAQGAAIPGVMGPAATAALFAGRWTEVRKAAARPTGGQRLYELVDFVPPAPVSGALRPAQREDVPLIVDWMLAFIDELGERGWVNVEEQVRAHVEAGLYSVWDDEGPRSMARRSVAFGGVTRIGPVYTPPERRGRGYASACVGGVAAQATEQGLRAVLYTDLANPVSNSVYRRLGFRAVSEQLRYEFEQGAQ